VNDTVPHVLRLAVPAGTHRVHALVGDADQPSAPTTISLGSTVLAESPALGNGEFSWLEFTVDGGTVDLTLSGDPGEHWHLAALLVE
ncbi:MAG TPA: hypothetical protein VHC49_16195, partial [Mycobacteriales bacterium]|nr:hypothetical protein [Mycobacteriales bacterium]